MKSNWRKVDLEEVILFKNGKKRPLDDGDIPVYGGNGVLNRTTQANNSNCIIIGRVGVYCGSVYYEPSDCWVSDNAIAALPKETIDIIYSYYLLCSLKLNARHIGTGQPLLTQGILNGIEVVIPDLETQKKIGSLLKSIDDKIKLNNAINNNLRQQVQAIYQNLIASSTDNKVSLSSPDHVKILPAKITKYDGKKIYIATADVTEYDITNKETLLAYNNRPSRANMQPVPWSLWFAKMKASPKFIFINDQCDELVNSCIFSTGFYGLHVEREMFYYLWAFISSPEFDKTKDAYCSGTTMQALNNDGLNKISVCLPSAENLHSFTENVEPIFNMIHSNDIENEKLQAIRDALLTKLMSGELDVSNIDL